MTAENESNRAYTMGYSDEFMQLLNRRNAAHCAAYLLPSLEPGMRLLDLGCGPGSITVGLAATVSPGQVHGVDMEESQINLARAAAASGGHDNVTFHVGNALELPFEDNYFDVVHCHAVIMHIPDTRGTLAEVRRVLKPGGILAAREMIGESCFFEPRTDGLREMWDTFISLMRGNGGYPDIGKELKPILHEAGFSDVQCSASFDSFGNPADVAFFHGFVMDWFFSPRTVNAIIGMGIATQEKFDYWHSEMDSWRDTDTAFSGLAFGECLARKS